MHNVPTMISKPNLNKIRKDKLKNPLWRRFLGDKSQRALWLKEKDINTLFFLLHTLANSHRMVNHMRGLKVDGAIYEGDVAIWDQMVQFYEKLYK